MSESFKPGIQGLRALAVMLVLVYHIWPNSMGGGYVGVDVFFVISGFLITGILYREAAGTGGIDVLGFYAKRIRRLAPAATGVLVAVAVCIVFVPQIRHLDTAKQIVGSALYFQNWLLASQAVDYLAAENAAGPLQHFWSLSVEEQYYIGWPLVFLAASALGKRISTSMRTVFLTIISVAFVWSLAYSIYLTPKNPGWAYFSTLTRIWELALGGALAVLVSNRQYAPVRGLREVLVVVGTISILASASLMTAATAFPGYAALAPTLGAAALLWVLSSNPGTLGSAVFGNRLMVYIGDISYSLYLWHWPVVVFAKFVLRVDELGLREGVVVAAISLALAHTSKQLLEDRWRAAPVKWPDAWKTYVLGLAAIALSLGSAMVVYQRGRSTEGRAPVVADAGSQTAVFHPSVMDAESDTGRAYKMRCITTTLGVEVEECNMVSNPGGRRVVLVGDSHAVAWLPALEVVAKERGWELIAVVKSACTFADFPEELHGNAATDTMKSCLTWSKRAIERVRQLKPDILLVTHSRASMSKMADARDRDVVVADAIYAALQRVKQADTELLAIIDTPRFAQKVPECMSSLGSAYTACGVARERAFSGIDPLSTLAARHEAINEIDMTDQICSADRCEPVVRGILAWRDAHHMTGTFSESLSGELGRRIDQALVK
ncbi:acyltransferase family protein [Stenotrophomonas sp.]|uniref:acyltransferase family protein n=1 Tax=Stenotrophomonas sp. TaxID=69392 RepID=UPI0028B21399|nr:acyltransferase family protein [Stenotrophomonas sp.]